MTNSFGLFEQAINLSWNYVFYGYDFSSFRYYI